MATLHGPSHGISRMTYTQQVHATTTLWARHSGDDGRATQYFRISVDINLYWAGDGTRIARAAKPGIDRWRPLTSDLWPERCLTASSPIASRPLSRPSNSTTPPAACTAHSVILPTLFPWHSVCSADISFRSNFDRSKLGPFHESWP